MAAVLACPGKVISIKMIKFNSKTGKMTCMAYFATAIAHPANICNMVIVCFSRVKLVRIYQEALKNKFSPCKFPVERNEEKN